MNTVFPQLRQRARQGLSSLLVSSLLASALLTGSPGVQAAGLAAPPVAPLAQAVAINGIVNSYYPVTSIAGNVVTVGTHGGGAHVGSGAMGPADPDDGRPCHPGWVEHGQL